MRWRGRPAWSEYAFLWFFIMVFGVRTAFALWIGQRGTAIINSLGVVLFVTLTVFFRQTTHYTMTHEAVYKTKGLVGTSESRVPLLDIASVSVRQSALERVLGIGTVLLHLKGGAREQLVGLKDPAVIQRKIEALLTHAKRPEAGDTEGG